MSTGSDADRSIDPARASTASDRDEITQVMYRYATAVLHRDLEMLLSCFSHDAVLDYGDFAQLEGEDAIREQFGGSMARRGTGGAFFSFDEAVVSTPVMANIVVEVDGDRAHAEHTCLAIHAGLVGEAGSLIVRGTRNVDDLVRSPDGWRIRHRRHETLWTTQLDAVVPRVPRDPPEGGSP